MGNNNCAVRTSDWKQKKLVLEKDRGQSVEKGKIKTLTNFQLKSRNWCNFVLKTINENVNTTFISIVKITSDSSIALNKRTAGQGSILSTAVLF